MARAFAYADGRDPEQAKVNVAPEDRAGVRRHVSATDAAGPAPRGRAAPHKPPAMDPVLHDIYSKETSSHLTEIREYLRKRTGQPAPHDLPESVYRAIHTLSGSSKMAEARHGIRITEPLNHVMRKVFDSGHGLSDTGLATLEQMRCAPSTTWCRTSMSRPAFFSDQPALLARLQRARSRSRRRDRPRRHDTSASAMVPALPRAAAARPLRDAAAAERARRRGGIRSRDREHLQRGGDRAAGGGARFADRLESATARTSSRSPSCSVNCTPSRAAREWPASPPWAI